MPLSPTSAPETSAHNFRARPDTSAAANSVVERDEALASCSLEIVAELLRLAARRKWPNQGSVDNALAFIAQVNSADNCRLVPKLIGVFRLQRLKRSLSIRFTQLRRNLHVTAATGTTATTATTLGA